MDIKKHLDNIQANLSIEQINQIKHTISQKMIDDKCEYFPGETLDISVLPMLITQSEWDEIKKSSEQISAVLEKTIDLIYQEAEVKNFFNFDENQQNLLIPKYKKRPLRHVHFARFDGFLVNGQFKLLEFNSDMAMGINRSDRINQYYLEEAISKQWLSQDQIINPNDLLNEVEKTFQQIKTHLGIENPVISCVHGPFDKERLNTVADYNISYMRRFLEAKGWQTRADSWKDFTYDGHQLKSIDGQIIDIIYRCDLATSILKSPLVDIEPAYSAYRDGNVYMANPPQSGIGSYKIIAALWRDEAFRKLLTPDEIQSIDKYIPWTDWSNKQEITYQGQNHNLPKWALANKDILVFKPIHSFGGRDVILGRDTEVNQWEKTVAELTKESGWLIQEYIEIPTIESIDQVDGNLVKGQLFSNINPWVIDGKVKGLYTRISKSRVINVTTGGGVAASLIIKDLKA